MISLEVISLPARSAKFQLFRQSGLDERPTRAAGFFRQNENPARQKAKRAFERAHMLVRDQACDAFLVQQGLDARNQHQIIGSQELDHRRLAFAPKLAWR